MRHFVLLISLIAATLCLTAGCSKTEEKPTETKPADVLSTQKEELQKAKDLEKQIQMQMRAEEQRKVIEVQTR